MKVCEKCGSVLSDNSAFCTKCGSACRQNQENPQQGNWQMNPQQSAPQQGNWQMNPQQGNWQTPPSAAPMDEKEFYRQYSSKKLKRWNVVLIVCCILSACANLGSFAQLEAMYGLDYLLSFDAGIAAVSVTIGTGIFFAAAAIVFGLKKKWFIALAIMAVSAILCIVNMAMGAAPSGWLIIVGGIYSMTHLYRLDRDYKRYRSNHILSDKPI